MDYRKQISGAFLTIPIDFITFMDERITTDIG